MNQPEAPRMHSIGKFRRLQRLLNKDGHFCIVAMDQRAILQRMLAQSTDTPVADLPFADMLAVKRLLVEELSAGASAMLFDPNIAVPAAIDILPRNTGLLVSLEHHLVEETDHGRKSHSIPHWDVGKIQKLGADGVKLLIWYHPHAHDDIREHQQRVVRDVGKQCEEHQLPFVLELLAYQPPGGPCGQLTDTLDSLKTRSSVVLDSVVEFTRQQYRVDMLKLESPIPRQMLYNNPVTNQQAFDAIGDCCKAAQVPWLMLSGGVSTDEFVTVLEYAYKAGAQGFLAGRAIWKEPLRAFPDTVTCRRNLQRSGIAALQRLLKVTRDHAQTYQPRPESVPQLASEGDFAIWFASSNEQATV